MSEDFSKTLNSYIGIPEKIKIISDTLESIMDVIMYKIPKIWEEALQPIYNRLEELENKMSSLHENIKQEKHYTTPIVQPPPPPPPKIEPKTAIKSSPKSSYGSVLDELREKFAKQKELEEGYKSDETKKLIIDELRELTKE